MTVPTPRNPPVTLSDRDAMKLLAAIFLRPQSPQSAPPAPLRSARAAVPNVTARACPDLLAGEPVADAQVSPPSVSARAVASTPRTVAYDALSMARRGRWMREYARPELAFETFAVAETHCAGVVAELVADRAYMASILTFADGYALLRDRARRARAMSLPKTGATP